MISVTKKAIILCVIMLYVVMLSIMAPQQTLHVITQKCDDF